MNRPLTALSARRDSKRRLTAACVSKKTPPQPVFLTFAVVAALIFGYPLSAVASQGRNNSPRPAAAPQHPAAPVERRVPSGVSPAMPATTTGPGRLGAIQHNLPPAARTGRSVPLAEWMHQHSQLSANDQQRALEREPGFHDLPQPTQERMRQRLSELDNMPPAQRQRMLARNEAMAHLSPDQRGEVRGAMQQLGALPQDDRRAVARTFRQLRDLPPDQRANALNAYRGQLNDSQRSTLNNLLRIEPMLPAPDRAPR